jgi:hypothetical protein
MKLKRIINVTKNERITNSDTTVNFLICFIVGKKLVTAEYLNTRTFLSKKISMSYNAFAYYVCMYMQNSPTNEQ